MVALDGVYVAGSDDKPVFRPLPHLKSDEVADVLQVAKTRILKALERPGAVRPPRNRRRPGGARPGV